MTPVIGEVVVRPYVQGPVHWNDDGTACWSTIKFCDPPDDWFTWLNKNWFHYEAAWLRTVAMWFKFWFVGD